MKLPDDLGFSPLQKNVIRWGVVCATVFSSVGIGLALADTGPMLRSGAHAVPAAISTSWITTGAVVSSSDLSTALNGLQTQITALATAVPTVSAATTAGSASGTGGFVSGSYTTPSAAVWLDVVMVGGGGGGGNSAIGAGDYSGAAGAGNATTFGSLTANGGGAGCPAVSTPGTCGEGGTVVASAYAPLASSVGGGGNYASSFLATTGQNGGAGGASVFGTSGPLVNSKYSGSPPGAGGSGGTGQGCTENVYAGSGGGAGGYVHAVIYPSAGQTFSYSVGSGGANGDTGSSYLGTGCANWNGQPGSPGAIYVTEHYQ